MPEAPPALPRLRRLALAGNPNVGKTTLFNLLTGQSQKVANYPGVTVERKAGKLAGRPGVEVVDLPGTYSLNPKSLDERVAFDVLVGRMDGEAPPDAVVCVVDATNLERNLYLVSQVLDLGLPTVVALNMIDAAKENGLEIDVAALERELGVPVVPMAARKKQGLDVLRDALDTLPDAPPVPGWSLMPAVERPVAELAETLAEDQPQLSERRRRFEALGALTSEPMLDAWRGKAPRFVAQVENARVALAENNAPYRQAEMIGRYGWLSPLASRVVHRHKDPSEQTLSDKIDAVLTHRVWGLAIFAALLALIFQAVFLWAGPAMDAIELGVGALSALVRDVLPAGWFTDLLVEGAITGVGNVVIFLPQILLLFFFLGLMEDTGYMARTAFIMDRLMRRLGLSGGSVVPLLSSYACAIPGIMAARTLDNERDRLITIMVAPLMACSARLPVYTLFIAAFIPAGAFFGFVGYQGFAMFSLYVLGTVMAFVAAWILRRFVFKGGDSSTFIMELPPYRLPQWKAIVQRMYTRSKIFAVRAGKIIFVVSIALWFLASFPKSENAELVAQRDAVEQTYQQELDALADQEGISAGELVARGPMEAVDNLENDRAEALALLDNEAAGYQIRNSFVGRLGHAVEPVMRPLGFDWKISAGILSAFAAREVIVSTLATLYSVSEEEDILLRDALQRDRYPDGSLVYTPLVAVSLLVFFVFALQCMSTLAIARRETGTWKWPIVMWLYMFVLAYAFSFVVYQGGQLLGWG